MTSGTFSGRLKRWALAVLLLAGPLAHAQWSDWIAPAWADTLQNPWPDKTVSAAEGKTLFNSICFVCHGNQGKGDGINAPSLKKPPADLTSGKVQRQSDGALFWKISEGNPPMLSFKTSLTEEQRWQVISYVRQLARLYPDRPEESTEEASAESAETSAEAAGTPETEAPAPVSPYAGMGAEDIFRNSCASCHTIGMGALVGPDLSRVQERHSRDWLRAWIRSSRALIESGDREAIALFETNHRMPMPDHDLNTEQIDELLAYIQAREPGTQAAGTVPAEPAADAVPATAGQRVGAGWTDSLILALVITAMLVILFTLLFILRLTGAIARQVH